MSATPIHRLFVLVVLLSSGTVFAAEPLPNGAVARFGSPDRKCDFADVIAHVKADGSMVWYEREGTHSAESPDGKLEASFSDDHVVRVFKSAGRQELPQLTGHTAYVASAVFAPDGRVIATGSNDRTLRLWQTASGKELHCCRGHGDQVCALAFAPDGKTLASASWDSTVRLWDVTTGIQLHRLDGHRFEVRGVVFAPDGKTLASGGMDGTVRIWDPATGKEVRHWTAHKAGVIGLAFFRKDGKQIIAVDAHLGSSWWETATGKEVGRTEGKEEDKRQNHIYCAAFSPDGTLAALGHTDGNVTLHDAATGKELRLLGRHPGIVWSVAFSPDGKTVASSARRHGVVRLWDVATGRMVRSYPGHGGGVSRVLFSADGKTLIAAGGSFDPSIVVYEVATGKVRHRLEGHTDLVDGIALSPDGRRLASVAAGDPVRLWDLAAGKELRHWPGPPRRDGRAAFTLDGTGLLAVDPTDGVSLYDVATGKRRHSLANGTQWLDISPDGRTLAACDRAITLVELLTGRERRHLGDGSLSPPWAVFTPDGRRLLAGNADNGTALLWDLTAGAGGTLTPRQRDDCWRDLGETDAARAYDAIWKFRLAPKESLPLLRERLTPAKAVDPALIPRRIAELDDDEFRIRERASRDLEQAGAAARKALQKALAGSPSAEVKLRVDALLAHIDRGLPGPDDLRALRGLEVMEYIGTADARQVVAGLTRGPEDALLTREAKRVLERMERRGR